jgi:hypothetical protein
MVVSRTKCRILRLVVRSGFPNIYLDQTVPAYLQNQVSDYATYQALQIALFSVHWTGAEKTKNPATSNAIPQIQAPTHNRCFGQGNYEISRSTRETSSSAWPWRQADTRLRIWSFISAKGKVEVSATMSCKPSTPSISRWELKLSVKPSV